MRADLRALVGIEEALEQSAEDRRVDQAPVEARRGEQEADFGMLKRQRAATVEQTAVELRDVFEIEIAAVLHVGEQADRNIAWLLSGLRAAVFNSFFHTPFGSSPTLSAKKQNTS